MAHNEINSAGGHDSTLKANPNALSATPTPGKPGKRSVELPRSSTCTPMCSAKKKPCRKLDRSSMSIVSLNVSSLSQSTTGSLARSTAARTTSTLRITRGVQTIPLERCNRYCQVTSTRVPKAPTATVAQQTDAVFVLAEPPPEKAPSQNACCQTDEPAVQEACIGTSQLGSPARGLVDGWCQTQLEDQSMAGPIRSSTPISAACEAPPRDRDRDVTGGEQSVESFATMLNNLAKEFGIDLAAAEEKQTEQNERKRKRKGGKEKQEPDAVAEVVIQERLVSSATKAVATELASKMTAILKAQLAEYASKMSANRESFMRWMKTYQTRQQQLEAKVRLQAPRRVLVVRKLPRRPSVKEKSTQCTMEPIPIVVKPPAKQMVTVGTQWQRQKQTVKNVKRKPAPKRSPPPGTKIKSKISTDGLPAVDETKPPPSSPTDNTRKGPMRQTKLSSYAEAGQRRQQQQQGKCTPKLPVKAPSPPPAPSPKMRKKKTPSPSPKQSQPKRAGGTASKSKSSKQQTKERTPEIHIEETPSEPSDTEPAERKYYPYRTQPRYPSQCSKSTETSFLTPTKTRDLHGPMEGGPAKQSARRDAVPGMANPSVLISPMGRMYVRSMGARQTDRSHYSSFLVPMASTGGGEVVPPTPQNVMYVNRPERRLLVRTKLDGSDPPRSVGKGLVREKYPEVSVISSQQLYSQIGLAVEKALKNRKMPSLDTMYGEPVIEVFNGPEGDSANDKEDEEAAGAAGFGERREMFVCSSAKDEQHQQTELQYYGSRLPVAPFLNDRSPSLSPIVYRDDDDSAEEFM